MNYLDFIGSIVRITQTGEVVKITGRRFDNGRIKAWVEGKLRSYWGDDLEPVPATNTRINEMLQASGLTPVVIINGWNSGKAVLDGCVVHYMHEVQVILMVFAMKEPPISIANPLLAGHLLMATDVTTESHEQEGDEQEGDEQEGDEPSEEDTEDAPIDPIGFTMTFRHGKELVYRVLAYQEGAVILPMDIDALEAESARVAAKNIVPVVHTEQRLEWEEIVRTIELEEFKEYGIYGSIGNTWLASGHKFPTEVVGVTEPAQLTDDASTDSPDTQAASGS